MTEPTWMAVARNEMGVSELPGPAQHNPRIVEYHAATSLKATSDEVPWCSSFLCWSLAKVGVKSTGSAAARSWLNWGEPCDARPGCIVVMLRKKREVGDKDSKNSGYHCAFWVAEDESTITLLGGNQSNRVRIKGYPKADYAIVYRWPALGSVPDKEIKTPAPGRGKPTIHG